MLARRLLPGAIVCAAPATTTFSKVQDWGSGFEGATVRATSTGTSATVSGLGTCQTHSYSIAAFDSVGESAKSATVTGTTTGCTTLLGGPGAPHLYLGWGNRATPQAIAGAYQQVISAYTLKAIDIDIENTDEFESEVVQDRILNALKIIKQNNPSVKPFSPSARQPPARISPSVGRTWWRTAIWESPG
jgi:hypothetical protein